MLEDSVLNPNRQQTLSHSITHNFCIQTSNRKNNNILETKKQDEHSLQTSFTNLQHTRILLSKTRHSKTNYEGGGRRP